MPTLEERVSALEIKFDAQTMNYADLRGAIGDLRHQTDQRFEHVDKRLEQIDRRFIQIDDRFISVERRFIDLEGHMNRRFDTIDQKIDRSFSWLAGMQVAVLVAVAGALVGSYFR